MNTSAIAQDRADQILSRYSDYVKALNARQFLSEPYRSFRRDTVLVWHSERKGNPLISVYNPFSKWKQWDAYMNGHKHIDSIRYIPKEHKLTARFRETTDFLDQIGMPEGFAATIHYWLDENDKVKEILYDWSENNADFTTQLRPLVEWAVKNDSAEIADLYLQDGFQPSWTNGIRWNRIVNKYNSDKDKQ